MNPFPKVARNAVTSSHFVPEWKSLDRTTKWVFLGMWTQEDESLFLEMAETNQSLKPRPYFARANPEMKRVSEDRRKARKAARKEGKGREYASYGKEK